MRLAELTTLRVGGEAESVIAPASRDELVAAVLELWASGDEVLLLGGGSNVVIGDDDFDGTVVRVVTRGVERLAADDSDDSAAAADRVRLRVQAGENWDALVALTVDNGWAGIEALSGIPGSCGAAPIQNIGAYGQELASALVGIEFLDFLSGDLEYITAAELQLGYRTSALKQGRDGLVVSIDLDLVADDAALSQPVAYAQLASALGVELGQRVPLSRVRETVLALRASKGMVLDATDPDSVSAGSFFTNPIVTENFARHLPAETPRWAVDSPTPDEYLVKLSAAWLIEQSGIRRGFAFPGSGAAVSSKHTLALVNRGEASATEISELARYIQTRVLSEFGVRLHPEPVFVGLPL